MHQGQFPEGYKPGGAVEYQRGDAAAVELSALRQRRMFLVAIFGMAGAGLGAFLYGSGGLANAGSADSDPDSTARGSLAWALEMMQRSDAELLQAGGDLERVSMTYRQEQSLLPVFERLLDLALVSSEEHADWAGACAIRSLGRLGRANLATYRASEIESSGRLPLMAEALETLQSRSGRGR